MQCRTANFSESCAAALLNKFHTPPRTTHLNDPLLSCLIRHNNAEYILLTVGFPSDVHPEHDCDESHERRQQSQC